MLINPKLLENGIIIINKSKHMVSTKTSIILTCKMYTGEHRLKEILQERVTGNIGENIQTFPI